MDSETSPTPYPGSRDVDRETLTLKQIEAEIRKVIVGQDYLIDRLLVGLLSRGHLLIEGVPGLAKTLSVKTLARTLDLAFQRIQFTPDLLPADLVGTMIFDRKSNEFLPHKGPVFNHIVLTDEINRAPAKVQSALLECMEERQVTLGDVTYELEDPFMVLATQNPIEQEGTYPLAEAQVDRFMMKLQLGYPSREEEEQILDRMLVETPIDVGTVLDRRRLLELRQAADQIYLDAKMRRYILDLITATRELATSSGAAGFPRRGTNGEGPRRGTNGEGPRRGTNGEGPRRGANEDLADLANLVAFGASPRATLFLARAVKGLALVRGRGYVIPEDVKEIAPDVLRHRIVPTYEAEAEEISTDDVVARLLDRIRVP